ncbi:hypothetical protein BSZ39_05565 [Bowdeniella nasicola]|uniref:YdbS-like PH domain-containing protein n=1 Tax=Bowdeniella nasicola TaxID=208480 RepID=A0A1Q5Q2X5_9ACTO|nr:PH domain-containing protein [Bowdeniella nasicola]OKL54188.1 hypothetical protein BSZ39_05565 [Bowdeniella nasicola]
MSEDVETPELLAEEKVVAWRAVHPVTPLIQAIKGIAVLFAIVVWQLLDFIRDRFEDLGQAVPSLPGYTYLIVIGIIAVVLLVIGLVSYLAWRRIRYAIGDEAVYYHHGILFRRQRHARLNRIQAVDLVRPLLARFAGLAAVDIQTAGGTSSNVQIQFLKEDDAQRVRNEILARAAGVSGSSSEADGETTVEYEAAPEREVVSVPTGQLITSILLSLSLVVALIGGIIFFAIMIWQETWAGLIGMLPAFLALGGWFWSRIAGEFGFTLAISPDGIRSRHGLAETRAQTIPPRRIQAVGITQPFLWRYKDWWRIEVNVAGYANEQSENSSTSQVKNVLLPVGSRIDLERVLWLILPDLGVDNPREMITALLTGTGDAEGFVAAPSRARYLDWFTWRRHGLRVTRTALLMRGGFFVRRAAIVPHERSQSLALSQGPLERALRIADLHAHSVQGPVHTQVHHLPEELTQQILFEQAERARVRRTQEGPEEWMRRVNTLAS